jgi:hypothetical protein
MKVMQELLVGHWHVGKYSSTWGTTRLSLLYARDELHRC